MPHWVRPTAASVLLLAWAPHLSVAQSSTSVRIARFNPTPGSDPYVLDNSFLARAQRDGYNYVVAELSLDAGDWDQSTGNFLTTKASGKTLPQRLTAAFKQVDSYHMKFIPLYQVGNQNGADWGNTNQNVQFNTLTYQGVDQNGNPATRTATSPVYSPDPSGIHGMDYSFSQLLSAIKSGFSAANLGYSLDYVHFGHDEPVNDYTHDPFIMIGQNALDKSYIQSHGGTGTAQQVAQAGTQALFAAEVQRRLAAVNSVLPGTKMLMYADALDPNHVGGWVGHWKSPLLAKAGDATTASNTITLSGALNLITSNKSLLILMPWQYQRDAYTGAGDYDTYASFRVFKNAGFTFIFASSVNAGCGDGNYAAHYKDLPSSSEVYQLNEFVMASQANEFKGYALGYGAFPWCHWDPSGPSSAYLVLEYLAHPTYYQASVYGL